MAKTTRTLMGIDPGFARVGYCVVSVDQGLCVHDAGVIKTEKSKQKVRVSDDNFARCKSLSREIRELLDYYEPRALCAEAMSFPRNASVAAKMAMLWGVLSTYAENRVIPVEQATPQEIKVAVMDRKNASKEDVAKTIRATNPRIKKFVKRLPKGEHEHVFDAFGSLLACYHRELIVMARR